MIQLAHATQAPAPQVYKAKIGAWVYTAVLTVMVVAQLYAFEKFLPLIADYDLPGGNGTGFRDGKRPSPPRGGLENLLSIRASVATLCP